jgi:hypothetical protein
MMRSCVHALGEHGRSVQGVAGARPYCRAMFGLPTTHSTIAVKLGPDGYYVVDGRHRVSVALATGRREIDAWVA